MWDLPRRNTISENGSGRDGSRAVVLRRHSPLFQNNPVDFAPQRAKGPHTNRTAPGDALARPVSPAAAYFLSI
jgi:hypothetical protein